MRKQYNISDAEHAAILKSLSLSPADYAAMKKTDEKKPAECTICLSDTASNAVVPCGHVCLCDSCADGFRARNVSACPYCRNKVEKIIKVFLG